MRGFRVVVAGAFLGAIVISGCGSSSTSTSGTTVLASGCAEGSGITASATTQSYVMRLDIGPVEAMYTPAQVASQHPTDGEVMISGTMSPVGDSGATSGAAGSSTTDDMSGMAGMSGMSGSEGTNTSAHHLEAHICSKASGGPIQGANPAITVTPVAAPSTPQKVPIAVMQGVTSGVSDYHYGNNVLLAPGAAYTVVVALGGQSSTFHVTIPAAASTTTTTTPGGSPGMNGM
ncbi:MAG: hypothetical protein ACRDZ8_04000 [Acidimicrobiales bacterium]